MSYISEIKEALNKIKYVFTKEYRKECEYIEFKKSMRDKVKLKCDSDESIDEKIDRLRLQEFKSNFHTSKKNANTYLTMEEKKQMVLNGEQVPIQFGEANFNEGPVKYYSKTLKKKMRL